MVIPISVMMIVAVEEKKKKKNSRNGDIRWGRPANWLLGDKMHREPFMCIQNSQCKTHSGQCNYLVPIG